MDDPYLPAIAIGSVRLLGTLAGTILLRRAGKKILILTTSLVMAAAIAGLGVNLHFQEKLVRGLCTSKGYCTMVKHMRIQK